MSGTALGQRRPDARRRRITALVATAVAGALVLVGCSGSPHGESGTSNEPQQPLSELDVLDDPRSYEGPSTAVLPDSAIEPIAEDPDQTLPATVTSYAQGGGEEEMTVESTDRVVALDLAGSIAASAWALGFGDTLVGKDQSTTFP